MSSFNRIKEFVVELREVFSSQRISMSKLELVADEVPKNRVTGSAHHSALRPHALSQAGVCAGLLWLAFFLPLLQ